MSSSTTPEDATVARTQQAKGGYAVYEVIAKVEGSALNLLYGVEEDSDTRRVPASDVLVYIGTYKAADPQLACWKAAEDSDAPFDLHSRAKGKQAPVLVAGTTGRGGLSEAKPYGLEPDPRFRRRST